jgi:hypothetical protein
MALVSCRECNNQVSDVAIFCPHCGAPRPAQKNWRGSGIDWKTNACIWGFPLIHVAFGRNQQGRLRVAKGVIAVGQFGIGLFTFAQFGIGLIFGFGQFIGACFALGQFGMGLFIGVGQFASGIVAVGQFVIGIYGLAQAGWAKYLWSSGRTDMEAVALFYTIYDALCRFVGITPTIMN